MDCVYYIFIMPRKCLNHPDTFCYMCGELIFQSQRQNFTPLIKKCYELYFGSKVGDQDKSWAPHICCVMCVRLLTWWINGSRQMPFTITMFWREPKDDSYDCYFCLTNIIRITSNTKYMVKYPDLPLGVAGTKASKKSDFQWWQLWFWWWQRTARRGQC